MKKMVLLLVVFAVLGGSAFAFDILSYPPPLGDGGSVMIDVGIGLRYWSGLKMTMPPLFLNVEYALPVGVPISVGGGIAFGQWKYNWWSTIFGYNYDYGYKVTYITHYARANWHWGFPIKWLDLYTGLSLGWDIAIVKYNDNTYSGSNSRGGFYYAFQAGAHFYFSEYVGAVVETGYPYYLKAGIALKFGGGGGSSGEGGSSKKATKTKDDKSKAEYMLVDADSLNVRKGPSSDTELVGAVKRNDRVQVLEKPGQWWKIKSGDIEGYVNSSYLKPAE